MKAAQFAAGNDPHLIAGFRGSQLASLENLAKSAAPPQAERSGFTDPSARPAAGEIHILALRHLAEFCGMGASKWMGQFAVGIPITGDLSQDRASPHKNPEGSPLPKKQIFASEEARFRERAPKSGWENAADLRTQSLGQSSKAWLVAPVILAESGRPADLPSGGYSKSFRFGGEQAGELRVRDDLKHGLTNQACRAHTPITLVSWGHLSQLFRTFTKDDRDWALFKADREAAYEQLPLDPSDQIYAIVALMRPVAGIWHGFRSRTLIFGSMAAVLHYNIPPALLRLPLIGSSASPSFVFR